MVGEYIWKRGTDRGGELEQVKYKCWDSERGKLFCHGHPLGRSEASEGIIGQSIY